MAIIGGVLVAPVAAHAQSAAQSARQEAPAFVPAPSPAAQDNRSIVPDDQFRDSLPPLDPGLYEPLPPIDPAVPAFPPEPGPVEDAPLGDPALSEPLPPLSTFSTEPVGEQPAASDEEGETVQRVRYTLVIEGMQETGLEGRFRGLSALDDAEGEGVNGAMIAARTEEDKLLVVRLLRSEGYYDAVASSTIEQLPEQEGRLRVTITVAAGNRYNFGSITIQGPETEPAGMAREFLPLTTGHPIRAVDVEAAEANVLLRLPQEGYPFPELGLRDIVLDPETRIGDYTLPLDPGPRARFGGFYTEGDLAFDERHVGILARFRRGELYDRRKVDDLREAMVSTRLFSTVSAEPVLSLETARGRPPICEHPRPAGCRPGPLARPFRRLFDRRGAAARGRLGASQPVSAGRRAARRRDRRHEGAEPLRPLPPQQLGPARPRFAVPARRGPARFRRLRGLYGATLRPGQQGIDADLAEALDLCLWRRAPGDEREPHRQREDLALRRLFHRRPDRAARL